jgi:hypothetical protein
VRTILPTIAAIITGTVILLGYFIDHPILNAMRPKLISWTILLAAIGLIVGVLNFLSVHIKRLQSKEKGSVFSLIVIGAFFATFALGIVFKPTGAEFQMIWSTIQIPVETSLLAVLTISLMFAIIQRFRRKLNGAVIVFTITTLIVLIASSGYIPYNDSVILQNISEFLNKLPLAGARGLLLGIALGGLTTGLRILLGSDRHYGG